MKLFSHFKTITRHRHEVIKNCIRAGLPVQGFFHDLSKYSPSEFFTGAKYYTGTKSPNEKERTEHGYSSVWLHHKGRNKHHFEYWTDYSIADKKICPVKMPLKYVIEMFCDRVAASKIYLGDKYTDSSPLEYYLNGKTNRFINSETAEILETLLYMLKDKGEDETFRYIKNSLLKKQH